MVVSHVAFPCFTFEPSRTSVHQAFRCMLLQVDAEAGSRLLAAKLERAATENATLEQRLEQVPQPT